MVKSWSSTFLPGCPAGVVSATILVMVVIFLLGFVLDFIEITFVVVPIVGPVLLAMGLDPVLVGYYDCDQFADIIFDPPRFGFALFYLRGVAPSSVEDRCDVSWRYTFYTDSATVDANAVNLASAGYVAAHGDIQLNAL